MLRLLSAFFLAAFLPNLTFASAFSGNKVEDLFTVKKIEEKQAILEGAPQGLKAGDSLYFVRSPFQFSVSEVKGNQVTITLPEKHSLAIGNTLMRNANAQVQKAMKTETRLKEALEE